MNTTTPPTATTPQSARLRRSRDDRMIAGVCGGLAQAYGIDVTLIRVLMVVAALFSGFGLVLYAGLWIFIPQDDEAQSLGAASYAEARRAYQARSQTPSTGFGTTPVPDARISDLDAAADSSPVSPAAAPDDPDASNPQT